MNCYNTGVISTSYACPAGGIVGSNGGLDVFNCYNVGRIDSSGNARGRGIGGHDSGSYTVSDCYYLDGCDDDPASNGWYVGTAQSIRVSVERRSSAAMQTQDFVDALNRNGEAYVCTAGGYPRLAWEAGAQRPDASVRVEKPEGGAISADRTGSVPAGTVLKLQRARNRLDAPQLYAQRKGAERPLCDRHGRERSEWTFRGASGGRALYRAASGLRADRDQNRHGAAKRRALFRSKMHRCRTATRSMRATC